MAKTNLTLNETKEAYEELEEAVKAFRDAVYKFTGVYESSLDCDLTDVTDDIAEKMFGLACDIGAHFDGEDVDL